MTSEVRSAPFSDPAARREYERLWTLTSPSSPFLDPSYLAALDTHSELQGSVHFASDTTLCTFTKQIGPFSTVVQPPHTPFCAWLSQLPGNQGTGGKSLLHEVSRGCSEATLLLPTNIQLAGSELPQGWSISDRYTFEIDVQSYSHDLQSENVRRISRKHGDDFDIGTDPALLDDVLALVNDSLTRKGIGFAHRSLVAKIARDMLAEGRASVYSCRSGEVVIAGIVLLHTPKAAAYWLAGSKPGPAMTVLILRMLENLRQQGVEVFDFVGANTPSVAEFKRRFGAKKISYQMVRRSPRGAFAVLKKIRRTLL